jgi:hypothetical protein
MADAGAGSAGGGVKAPNGFAGGGLAGAAAVAVGMENGDAGARGDASGGLLSVTATLV